VKKAPQETNN